MLIWYRTNRVALIGVLGSLLFGGLEVVAYLADGVGNGDRNTPIGVLLTALAGLFAEPPSAVRAGSGHEQLIFVLFIAWQSLATAAFTILLWLGSRLPRHSRLARTMLAAQMAVAVLGVSSLLYVLAAQLAIVLPFRRALAWLAVQSLLLVATFAYMALLRIPYLGSDAIATHAMHLFMGLSFQAIAFSAARIALAERAMRMQLAAANASLLATQSMLADTVRSGERNRIARDLHDAVGHHLTALNLHLDLALRQAGSDATAPLRTSRQLASSLLAEVREVVSSERGEQRIDLGAAIATLCAGIPTLRIDLHVDDRLSIDSPALAHTLFHCTQEALTNAVRHSGATELTIDLRAHGDSIILRVDDNGKGRGAAPDGNGLRGMRERVDDQGGALHAVSHEGRGFGLSISLPLARSGA
ncbi:sensor histidine kinase [Massilia sp. PAMC28688]|uniref:sensor histidine kinase n=1 Tax=Massilia sp. PAMC28688 TaxID=2861283 RepID=UPI001C6325B0|nr:sensor histidine kinase [Massilia sp. PAMC28688]QYF95631.1 sensor histidine kinase [Massilia sp. PAMC28688]